MFFFYHEAFPEEEKKPYRLIKRVQRLGQGRNFVIKDDKGRFLGIAFTLLNQDTVLLDYFAISNKFRGQGIGSRALRLLKDFFQGHAFILEIEDPELPSENREERIRRAKFYEKCGMKMMDYRISLFGVDMRILSSGENIPFERYHALLYTIYGEHFAKNVELLG